MQKIELLSPARTADIGIEAIRHGADAVYIGAESFGARAAAANTVDDIRRLVDFAHQFRAKVYVTVNTVLFAAELPSVERLCWQLWQAGVDALIVQDLQLLDLSLPPIPLHASTQMDIRTAEKVGQLARLGFRRVVLARELTLEQIAAIHQAHPDVELEVFVHGALCVSLSGRCNVSEALFRRSANRGECAQVCRMEMDLLEDGRVVLSGSHLLSLRDNCQLHRLEPLLRAGAVSLKIEGRLKDMAYVKNITAAYSQALDSLLLSQPALGRRASAGHVALSFKPDVLKSFNRGFVADVSRPDANIYTPKSMGQPLSPTDSLHNGDGLCYLEHGHLVGFRLNRADNFTPRPGIQYYRNFDAEWDKLMARPTAERRVWVDIDIHPDHISMTDEDGTAVSLDIDTSPFGQSLKPQADNICRQFSKLGGTLYEARRVQLHWPADIFVPSSILSGWRRSLVELLGQVRRRAYKREEQTWPVPTLPSSQRSQSPLPSQSPQLPYELTHDPDEPLMLTKYCLRRQLGQCLKEGGKPADWTLRLKNGKLLRLLFDCRECGMKIVPALMLLCLILLSCVGADTGQAEADGHKADTIVNVVDTTTVETDSALVSLSVQQMDSLVFRLTHHYSENFNFVVQADSLMLLPREGDIRQDTSWVYEGELMVVAAATHQADTVWVKVARDQQTMGWIAEQQLLRGASPSDPISRWLYWLSGSRGIWMSLLAAVGLVAILLRRGLQQRLQLQRFEEIDSPYPLLFIVLVAVMASVYASVQNFVPEYWQEYYFHPSLNPLVLPPVMALLVVLFWLLVITFIAVVDEVYRLIGLLHAPAYILELVGIGMIVYLVFSWTTLFYIGYPLLPAFLCLCYRRYHKGL
jgi:putative protease